MAVINTTPGIDDELFYAFGLGSVPIARVGATGTYFYLEDGLGSVVGMADGTQNLVARIDYEGFGAILNQSEAIPGILLTPGAGGDFRFQAVGALSNASNDSSV